MRSANAIPLLGLGTYPLRGAEAERAVAMALELGYRHIDTAQMYGNEAAVGRAVKASGLARRDFFIVTKVDPGNVSASRFRSSVEGSVNDLGDPPDLLLVHWPPPDAELDAVIDRLVEAHRAGYCRAIGVSNFSVALLRRAAQRSPVPLMANQVEFHPLIDQSKLLAEVRRLGMTLIAYRPLGRSAVLNDPVIGKIATKHGRPASEIALRWIVQQGVAAIPMTAKRGHAESNLRALSFALSEDDMRAISALGAQNRRLVSPSTTAKRWDE
ncbi:MAG: aldo/keto reductase [Rhizobiales bacterium]|nr:aldo/keto reductase [Hyphomicrobiales bacterium]MBI3674251.1 aldo/keto reductase [Hyphomicrobiales bacterium]